jgi:hypothetical protein
MSETYGAARELIVRAEEDAARIRAEADRYRRQREQEAELLVAKARRLLEVAEVRAASIASTPAMPRADGAAPTVVDLDRLVRDAPAPPAAEVVVPTGLDGMIKSAIAKAVDRSFHLGS